MVQIKIECNSMKKNLLLTCAIFLAILASGCGSNPEKQIVGHWSLDAAASGKLGQMAQSQGGITCDFKDDKTYHLGNGNGVSAADGSYTSSGRTFTLTIQKIDGQDVSKLKAMSPTVKVPDIIVNLNPDGKSMTMTNAGGSQPLTLKKS